jgi:NAD(P)-dependent dehydrogenase (short-subunit alcohol dehydrogenase family)
MTPIVGATTRAMTARLLPWLRRANQPRVANLSSMVHRSGVIDFDDLQGARSYRAWKAYSQSKLAMLIFALELQRRSDAAGWGSMSDAAHPGYARTDLMANGPRANSLLLQINNVLRPFISHSAADGRCQPCLRQPRHRRSRVAIMAPTDSTS